VGADGGRLSYPIGSVLFRGGVCRHRSLLLKYLVDQCALAGVPWYVVSPKRGGVGASGSDLALVRSRWRWFAGLGVVFRTFGTWCEVRLWPR